MKTSLGHPFPGMWRGVLVMLLFLSFGAGMLPSASHAGQGKPDDALIQTFIKLYQDKNPANRVAAMLLSVGMVDHAPLVAALRKRLPTAQPGEKELVLYTMAALSYDPLTRTSTNPADIDAWLDAFPADYATYKKMSGAEEVLAVGVWNTQITDFLVMLFCDPAYHDKAGTALAQDGEFRSAIPDAMGRPWMGNQEIYRACLQQDYTHTRTITSVPADPGEPFSWGDASAVGERLAALLDHKDPVTRMATLLVLRNITFDSFIYMEKLKELRKGVQDPQERVLIDVLYKFPDDYSGKKTEAQLCRDFPKTPEGIASLLELEKSIYTRHYLYLVLRYYDPGFIRCPDENGVPLSFHILQAGRKYMTDTEYSYYMDTIAASMIGGGGPAEEDKHRYRRAVRVGFPEFKKYYADYVKRTVDEVESVTYDDVEEKNKASIKERNEAYIRKLYEVLNEINSTTADQ